MKTFITTTALVASVAFAASAQAGGVPVQYKAPAPVYTAPIVAPVVSAPAPVRVAAAAPAGNYVSAPAGLEVTAGGFLDFQAGFVDAPAGGNAGQANGNDVKFRNDTEIHLGAHGTTDSGLAYGAVIELEADVSADAGDSGTNADKTYLYVEGDSGRFELGNVDGAQSRLAVGGSDIAVATGGVSGDWRYFVNASDLDTALTGGALLAPALPNSLANELEADSTKISYYAPSIGGLNFGLSYTPEDDANGQALGGANTDQENLIGLGLNYALDWDGIGVELSLTGEFGSAATAGGVDREAFAFGLGLNFGGFQVAGSFGDLGDVAVGVDGDYMEAGIAYETGEFGLSLGYFGSEVGTTEAEVISLGADYQLAPGLVPYVEVNFYDIDAAGTANDVDGTVVLVGTQLNF